MFNAYVRIERNVFSLILARVHVMIMRQKPNASSLSSMPSSVPVRSNTTSSSSAPVVATTLARAGAGNADNHDDDKAATADVAYASVVVVTEVVLEKAEKEAEGGGGSKESKVRGRPDTAVLAVGLGNVPAAIKGNVLEEAMQAITDAMKSKIKNKKAKHYNE